MRGASPRPRDPRRLAAAFGLVALTLAAGLAAGCGEAARTLSTGPGGLESALSFIDALRSRYGVVEREPALEALRPKLSAAVLAPSRIFDEASIWTVSEGEQRAFWLEGRGHPGAYRLGLRRQTDPPRAPGEYRGRLALSRLEAGRFEWNATDELALGPLRPEELAAAYRALLRAAEAVTSRDARPDVRLWMPRSVRAFGRLFDLERLLVLPAPDETRRVEIALRLQPARIRPEAPRFASYVARYSRGFRVSVTALVPDGRTLWSARIEDTVWTLHLRLRAGSLVPLDGAPRHEPGKLRAIVDYTFKSGMFRVGVKGLPVEVDPAPRKGELAFAARFVEQPDWQLPFLIEPFMRGSLRYPFEPPGSAFSLAVRPEPGRGSVLVSDSRVRIR